MKKLMCVARGVCMYLYRNWFPLFALLVYVFFTAYYMGPGLTKCNDSIYGFGDSTAGPIWQNSLKPEQPPFGGFETKTNYPYGESLYSPVRYASTVQTLSMNAASRVIGPVCSYNMYNVVGAIITALAMYGFILYITRNKWVALLAGYAVAFTPYIQSKVGGHPSYSWGAILIALLWLTVYLFKQRRKVTAIALGALLALCAYFDPYFTLLGATVVVPTSLSLAVLSILQQNSRHTAIRSRVGKFIRDYWKVVAIAIVSFTLVLLPLIVVRLRDSAAINSSVAKSRENILATAMLCSNTPLDYLLPDPYNLPLNKILGKDYAKHNIELRNWCGPGESRVSISLAMLSVATVGGVVMLLSRKRGLRELIKSPQVVALTAVVAVGVTAFLIGLPPRADGLIQPSGILLKLTNMWRNCAREYLVVNIAVVACFSIVLAGILRHLKRGPHGLVYASIIFVAILGGIMVEYQINDSFSPPTFSYSRDVPNIYHTIKNDPNIKAIAEYPMDRMAVEYDSVVYYMTMQAVHQKPFVNSVLSTDNKENEHISLKDLSDPQTIPALRYLGVDTLVVHGETTHDVLTKLGDNVTLIDTNNPKVYGLTMVRSDDNNIINLLHIRDGKKANNILAINKGYAVNLPLIQSPISTEYEILNNAQLTEMPLKNEKVQNQRVCFDVKMSLPTDSGKLNILVNGKSQSELSLTGVYQTAYAELNSNDIITLTNTGGNNMRINNLNGDCS